MVLSYFNSLGLRNYKINEYRYKKLDENHILVTTIHGGWVVLSKKEFNLLRFEQVEKDPNLFKQLESNGIIITKDNEEKIIEIFKRRNSFLFNSICLHIISPTLRCNHRCIYCHAKSQPMNKKGYDMDQETAKKVVDFIFQSPSNSITIEFQGGEPLLNFPIIEYIVDYSKKINQEKKKVLRFNLVSNLTKMDHEILRFLIKNKVHLNTSLDGPKEVHDKNRKYLEGKSSYGRVVQWIDIIKKQYRYPLSAIPTITKFSLPFYKEIIDEYRKGGFRFIRMRQMNNAGFAAEFWKKIGYRPIEYVEFWKKSLNYILELNKLGMRFVEGMTTLITRKFISGDYPKYTCWGSPCGAALSQCAYDHNGNIYTCDESRSFDIFRIGSVENSYKDVFSSAATSNIISLSSGLMTECAECVWHPFCGSCLVCTYGQQKNVIGKMSIDNECKIRMSLLEHIIKKLIFEKKDSEILIGWASSRIGV